MNSIGDMEVQLVRLHLLAQPNQENRRLQREAQANAIRSIVVEKRCPDCEVIVLGYFNDYDGASDTLDHVKSAPITNVMLALERLDPADPAGDLINTATFVPNAARFTAFWDHQDDANADWTSVTAVSARSPTSPGASPKTSARRYIDDLKLPPSCRATCRNDGYQSNILL